MKLSILFILESINVSIYLQRNFSWMAPVETIADVLVEYYLDFINS